MQLLYSSHLFCESTASWSYWYKYLRMLLAMQVRSSILVTMNRLDNTTRAQVVKRLCDGNSIRATVRITGVAKNTVVKLLCDLGAACAEYHHENVRGLRVRRLQCDAIWSFVGSKAKNTSHEKKTEGCGDAWTWTAIDADSKLIVSYLVGGRDAGWAYDFIQDCADRIKSRVQVTTTDGHKACLEAVEGAFGMDADYAQLQKIYGAPTDAEQRRYSPAQCIGSDMKVPDPTHVSTSHVERQNLPMRMSMRRFTNLTNGFSKKIENHIAAVSLYFMYYDFCRVHQTLRVTPAMEAGISNHVWSVDELVSLLDKSN